MGPAKPDKLTTVTLSVFRLNGLLVEWGDVFCLPHGLTSARWQVLGALSMARQAPSVPQIAVSMGVTRQGVQKQINLLVEEGLVQPQPNPAHKRSPLYVLTERGEKIYQALYQRWRRHVQALSRDFDAADLDAAIRVLSALSNAYSLPPEGEQEA